ncbi:MAG: hypothetical protein K6T61_00010 [Bryobacteraceae bacterium]|nr:hypothetical protein [Bryobacteraceae bacterium]
MRRLTLGGLALALGLAAAGCEPAEAPKSAQAAAKMTVTLKLDRSTYEHTAQGPAVLKAQLVVHNPGPGAVRLTFPSSQRYDLEVRNERGQVVVRWSEERAFAMVLGEEDIPPGEKTYGIELKLASEGGQPLPAGRYTARGWVTCTEPEAYSATAPFEIRAAR